MTKTDTAMIGSLPHAAAAEAIAALRTNPLGIPTWPQLPKVSFKESMLVQYSEGMPGLVVDEIEKRIFIKRDAKLLDDMAVFYDAVLAENIGAFAMGNAYAAGFSAFVNDRAEVPGRYPAIKGQVTGPFTITHFFPGVMAIFTSSRSGTSRCRAENNRCSPVWPRMRSRRRSQETWHSTS